MKTLIILSLSLALVYIAAGILLYIFQRDLLYFPSEKYKHSYEEQVFYNDNESIKVIVLNSKQEKGLLYFGGNAEAVINNAPDFLKNFPHHTVYLVNYRGYGGSSGQPEELALYSDALAIYDNVKTRHHSISIIGRSLGSGVATLVASKRKIDKLVLITPFDSIENIAQSKFPFFPISYILKDKYDSASRVKKISAKTLIIIAQNDTIIPFENSMTLVNTFPSSQRIMERIKNTGHNNLTNKNIYHTLIKQFIPAKSPPAILNEILTSENAILVTKTTDFLLSKANHNSTGSLTTEGVLNDSQNLIFQIDRLMLETNSGSSFEQYFRWVTKKEVEQIVEQINKLDLPEVSTLVGQAINIAFPEGVPANEIDYSKSTQWSVEQEEQLDHLFKQFEPYNNVIINRLAKYIKAKKIGKEGF